MMKFSCGFLLVLGFTIALCFAPSKSLSGQSLEELTTVVLVRHAERDDGVDTLNQAGIERALELKRMLANAGVDAIYASSYYRSQQTAQPLADALGLELNIYDPRKLDELAYLITNKYKGETILITGHSNVTPMTVNALGVKPAVPNLEHQVYDHMYVVTITKHRVPKLVVLRYGVRSD